MISFDATLPIIEPIERVEVFEVVYKRIREMIMLGDLVPASKIALDYLSNSLQVSRTTVANAFQRMNLEGLVYVKPRRGTFVSRFKSQDVHDFYESRLCFELWASQKVTAQITDEELAEMHRLLKEASLKTTAKDRSHMAAFAQKNLDFHTYLVSLAGNEKMLSFFRGLHLDVLGYRIFHIRETSISADGATLPDALRPAEEDHREHQAIVRAFEARNPSLVEKAIRSHLTNSLENHLRVFSIVNHV